MAREGGGGAEDLKKLAFGALGGAFSGLLPRLVTYPLETLKSRSQVRATLTTSVEGRTTWANAVTRTWRSHGILKGFFPGVHVALLGTIPGSATYFFGYELGKAVFQSDAFQDSSVVRELGLGKSAGLQGAVCGISAQLFANVIYTPVDITKERMQVQASLVASGQQDRLYTTTELVKRIANKEGLSVFMRGYWRGNMLWVPWSTVYISTYESLKDLALSGDSEVPGKQAEKAGSNWMRLGACAAAASAVACVCTHPIDVLKTRMQALPPGILERAEGGTNVGIRGSALQLWRKEGMKGLFAGLQLRVLQLSPATVMTWIIYEKISGHLNSR
ncbi:mitochondrial carrier protein [Chloropicon primus]|uniref:Mitochondrial carrier protein n=1 Tax=Chloropicon primus TaxID=1764295 RepID=A0A5B8MYG4_9CHLO|nr:mitochondrial carrier protein [Chloropicon primus]UPR05033.1 mitochondrial carrier protein [Chloropicon primus]|mmetsp:Transcript_12033/g.33314  ORF Transcript_12033/g.33314 Transcript_12033/m.33314 type:complete len:332 (+) Transcript_12033:545-1540(+)|eukprot:QDZ25838.1 mitochondrial carrier protein [Chloropicon primus]